MTDFLFNCTYGIIVTRELEDTFLSPCCDPRLFGTFSQVGKESTDPCCRRWKNDYEGGSQKKKKRKKKKKKKKEKNKKKKKKKKK